MNEGSNTRSAELAAEIKGSAAFRELVALVAQRERVETPAAQDSEEKGDEKHG